MRTIILAAIVGVLSCGGAAAQPARPSGPPSAAALAGGSHAEVMRRLAFLHGVWAGEAVTTLPNGQRHRVWQTERFGDLLGGDLKLVEGRGYEPDGRLSFNAFAVISYDPRRGAYEFRSYAAGQAGTFPVTLLPNGYVWEIPAGPATLRYTATVNGDRYHEVGERVAAGQPPVRFFEMILRRTRDTEWPLAGFVPSTEGRPR